MTHRTAYRFALAVAALLLLFFHPGHSEAAAPPEYRLGSGDIIRITVFQNPDLTTETRVSERGDITFPLVGNVPVGGLNVSSAEQAIASRLRSGGFVLKPQVNILPLQFRSNQVAVLGQVNRPGRYPLDTASRLSDMLATAGGIAQTGADTVELVGVRNGEQIRKQFDIHQLFVNGSETDETLQGGDTIYVDRAPQFYIYGQVQRPGAFRLERNMTVMQGLATAGGLTMRGTDWGLRVNRRGPDGKVTAIEPDLQDLLQPEDVIYVREGLF